MKEGLLYDYCRWNSFERARKLLQESGSEIDLTYHEGVFFGLALAKNNKNLVSLLLQQYETNNLEHSVNSIEYKRAKSILKEILEEEVDIDDEMLDIIKPYLVIDPSYKPESFDEEHYSDIDLEFAIDDHEPNFGSEYFEQMSGDVDLTGTSLIECK